jgi:integrase
VAQDSRYLTRQRQGWYCVVEVPPTLRGSLGRRIKRTLKTTDIHVARARRWRVIAEIKAIIETARKAPHGDSITQEALAYREAMVVAEQDDTAGPESAGWDDEDAAIRAAETSQEALLRNAVAERAEAIEKAQGPQVAQAFYEMATGQATPIASYVDQWLSEGALRGAPLKERTKAERRRAVAKFADWLQRSRLPMTVEAVSRRVAGRYVSEALIPSGRDASTLGKSVRSLAAYWAWLQRRGHLPDEVRNPWSGQAPQKVARDVTGIAAERAFTDVEIARLLTGHADVTMADFIRVGALTGMRREEIGQLTAADCVEGVFIVREGKTAAAARRIPIHSRLAVLVEARCKGKLPGAFLFHELPSKSGERTDAIGRAFMRYRRKLGIQEWTGRRSSVNFHSLRRWFITAAINAPQPPHIVSLVVGHKEGREGMTMGRYWQGADDAALRACVEAVRLPVSVATAGASTDQDRAAT